MYSVYVVLHDLCRIVRHNSVLHVGMVWGKVVAPVNVIAMYSVYVVCMCKTNSVLHVGMVKEKLWLKSMISSNNYAGNSHRFNTYKHL